MKSSTKHTTDADRPVRFVVGIDLGTTNSALCYIDLQSLTERSDVGGGSLIHDCPIPQGVAPNVVESRLTLPSFFSRLHDVPPTPWSAKNDDDLAARSRRRNAPNDGRSPAVGAIARDYGAAYPDAFVASAKSWLCNVNVDRASKLLPLRVANDQEDAKTPRWSPVEISSFYLAHLRAVWNDRFPEYPLETQDVVLTIPASFDESARTLTLQAAKLAKLTKVALVEEPQAAFYSWLERHEEDWFERVRPGDRVLVCDVGGGTTDFALIYALRRDESADLAESASNDKRQSVKFYRVAVGDHLLLGGDNLDLALARYFEQKIFEKRKEPLSPRERAILLRESRETKEAFLSDSSTLETRRVLIPSATSKLVAGGSAVEATRKEVEALLVDGFFPRVPLDARPIRRHAGLREIALPYAADPAITKHLAAFLTASRSAGEALARAGVLGPNAARIHSRERDELDLARPDAILFNGGAFESPILRERIVETIAEWFADDDKSWRPTVLQNDALFLSVARGAAYYGLVLRGYGERVGASLARSYYAEVALDANADRKKGAPRQGVCVLSAQAEPGDEITLPQIFELEVDKPVSFPLHVSSVRATDAPGDLVELDPNETRELSPIRTTLKTRSQAKKEAGRVKARLVARPTEIGVVELYLQEVPSADVGARARPSRWTLQFDARGAVQSDWEAGDVEGEKTGVVDESLVENALEVLDRVFADDKTLEDAGLERLKPNDLFRQALAAIGVSKNDAPITTLRRLAERTLELADGRKKSPAYEARMLNWLGFALRPGFGAAADDWRVEQTWKTFGGRLAFNTLETRAQYWILWRRVASGLTLGRQQTLAEPLTTNARALRKLLVEGKGRGPAIDMTTQEGAEIWRLLGALELLPLDLKIELGDLILDLVPKKKTRPVRDALVWALGRLGARRLFHAPLDRVAPPDVASRWTRRFLDDLDAREERPTANEFFTLAQLTRRAEDPAFDVAVELRETVAAFLLKHGAEDSTLAALRRHGELVDEATRLAFGESLPLGLRWN